MQNANGVRLTAGVLLTLAALATAAATACSPDSTSPLSGPALVSTNSSAMRTLTPEQQGRLEAARERSRWVGNAHHAAMQVVIKNITEHRRSKRPLAKKGTHEFCALMEEAGETALAALDAGSGFNRSQSDRRAEVRRDPGLAACKRGLSVFGLAATPVFAPSAMQWPSEAEVTGAFELYLDPLEAAVQEGDGSVADMQVRVQAVVAQAASTAIPAGDLLVLAATAGLIESSAAEWNAFDWSNVSVGGCSSSDGCYAMSVFPFQAGDKIRKIISADVAGCLAGLRSWGALRTLLLLPAWEALAGACGLRAAIASGVAIYMI